MTAVWLVAASTDPSLPVNISALAALIGIVWWLVRRSDSADERRDVELSTLRSELAELRELHTRELAARTAEVEIQRDEKHTLINRLAASRGALTLVHSGLAGCDCESMSAVKGLVDQLTEELRGKP